MKYALALVVLSCCVAAVAAEPARLIRLHTRDAELIRRINSAGTDIAGSGYGWLDVVVPADDQALKLAIKGVRQEVILDDVNAPFEAYRDRPDLGIYHTMDEVAAEVQAIAAAHPDIVHLEVVGTTTQGRPIHALRISDNAAVDEPGEPCMFFMGAVHAREWIAVEVPMAIIDHLVDGYGTDPLVTRLVNDREIWVVPAVNLDGIQYSQTEYKMWRKTRRDNGDGTCGVDANRNWGYQWGGDGSSSSTSSDTYRGPEPFSEPCIAAMRDLVLRERPIACTDYHSYSELVLWPWGYTYDDPADADFLSFHGREMARIMGHYTPEQASDLYTCSGVSGDWFYGEMGMLCYTFEFGTQFIPAEADVPEICRRATEAAVYMLQNCVDPFPLVIHRPLETTIDPEGPYDLTVKYNRRHHPDFDLAGIDVVVGDRVIPMTAGAGDVFTAAMPGLGYGTHRYRVVVRAGDGTQVVFPTEGDGYEFAVVDTLYLVVDDDRGRSYESYYTTVLDGLGIPYRVWDVKSKGSPYLRDMLASSGLIWFTGEDSSETLTPFDQEQLTKYFMQGGRLLVFGQDIGYDLKNDEFYGRNLKATYVLDKSGVEALAGTAGTFLAGTTFSLAKGDNVHQSFPEVIAPNGNAYTLVDYVGGDKPMVAAIAIENAASRIAYFGFGLEGVDGAAARATLLGAAMQWLAAPAEADMVRATALGRQARRGDVQARRALDGFWTRLPERLSAGEGASIDVQRDRSGVAPVVLRRFRSALRRAGTGN